MQSIAGFFKKVISPSGDRDIASNQDSNAENLTKIVAVHKGDNSSAVDEADEELTEDLRILKDTVYGSVIRFNSFIFFSFLRKV